MRSIASGTVAFSDGVLVIWAVLVGAETAVGGGRGARAAPGRTARGTDARVPEWAEVSPTGDHPFDASMSSAGHAYSTIGQPPSDWSSGGEGWWDEGGGGGGVGSQAEVHDGGWHHQQHHEYKLAPPALSVSAVFQMSLTALAFLAFAGFLLHLVVLAGKGVGDRGSATTTPTPSTAAETLVLVPLKRPKAHDVDELTRRVAKAIEEWRG